MAKTTLDDFVDLWKEQKEVAELAQKLHDNQIDKETSDQYWADFIDKLKDGEKALEIRRNRTDPEDRAHFAQLYSDGARKNIDDYKAVMPKIADLVSEAKGKLDADKYAELIAMINPDDDKPDKAYETISKAVKAFNKALEPLIGKLEDRRKGNARVDPDKLRKILGVLVDSVVGADSGYATIMKSIYEDDRAVQAEYGKMIVNPAREDLKKAIKEGGDVKKYAVDKISKIKKDEQLAFFDNLYAALK